MLVERRDRAEGDVYIGDGADGSGIAEEAELILLRVVRSSLGYVTPKKSSIIFVQSGLEF